MDDILGDLEAIARRCERVAEGFDKEPLGGMIQRLADAAEDVGRSWCRSWLDYHSTVYLTDFKPAVAGEVFDPVWGIRGQSTRGDWTRTKDEDVIAEIQHRSGVADLTPIKHAAKATQEAFNKNRSELMPVLDALNSVHHDTALQDEKTKLSNLNANSSFQELIKSVTPRQLPTCSRDELVVSGGLYHRAIFASTVGSSPRLRSAQLRELAGIARHVKRYLEIKHRMEGKSIDKAEEEATIGHGRPDTRLQSNELIQDRPKLEGDEFNQSSPAGMTTKDHLEAMLDDGDIVHIPTWRQVVQEIIDGKRDRHLYEKKLGIGEYVEFFSARPIHAHRSWRLPRTRCHPGHGDRV